MDSMVDGFRRILDSRFPMDLASKSKSYEIIEWEGIPANDAHSKSPGLTRPSSAEGMAGFCHTAR